MEPVLTLTLYYIKPSPPSYLHDKRRGFLHNKHIKTNILESNSPNRIFPCIFHYTKSVTPSIYKLIPFSSISRQKDIVLILYACFKLRKQHQIKPQKRIIIQRNCVFPHKSCIYANQSQEIEKSFGAKRNTKLGQLLLFYFTAGYKKHQPILFSIGSKYSCFIFSYSNTAPAFGILS